MDPLEGNENPINSYGSSKYKGGLIVKEYAVKYTILHTYIFGRSLNHSKISFIDNIIEKLEKGIKYAIIFGYIFFTIKLIYF